MDSIFRFMLLPALFFSILACNQKNGEQAIEHRVVGCDWISKKDLDILKNYKGESSISIEISKVAYAAIEQANCFVNREEYVAAINLLSFLLDVKVDRENIRAIYKARGIAYYQSGSYEHAIADLTKAVNPNFPDFEIFYFVGRSFQQSENSDEAINTYMLALETSEELTAKRGTLPSTMSSRYIKNIIVELLDILVSQERTAEAEKVRARVKGLGLNIEN